MAIIFFHFLFSVLSFLWFQLFFFLWSKRHFIYIYKICTYVCAYACILNYIHNCILQAPRKEWSKQSSDKTEGTDFSSISTQRSHHSFYKERRADFGMVRDPGEEVWVGIRELQLCFPFCRGLWFKDVSAKQRNICWGVELVRLPLPGIPPHCSLPKLPTQSSALFSLLSE